MKLERHPVTKKPIIPKGYRLLKSGETTTDDVLYCSKNGSNIVWTEARNYWGVFEDGNPFHFNPTLWTAITNRPKPQKPIKFELPRNNGAKTTVQLQDNKCIIRQTDGMGNIREIFLNNEAADSVREFLNKNLAR